MKEGFADGFVLLINRYSLCLSFSSRIRLYLPIPQNYMVEQDVMNSLADTLTLIITYQSDFDRGLA